MAITTRYGNPVEIRYRCDDFDEASADGTLFVHAFYADDPNGDPIVVPTWELRADEGILEVHTAANAAPKAGCTGQHAGRKL